MHWNNVVSPALTKLIMGCCLSCIALMPIESGASAQTCKDNPEALGTSRVLALDPAAFPQVGTFQYPQTVPLRDHEVVLTFDDGPAPSSTDQVLDVLASQCVKATFFIVGEHALVLPDRVRREYSEGHTIGTHSETHADLGKLSLTDAKKEIEAGIESTSAALGPPDVPAPFFRAPYLSTTPRIDQYLSKSGIMLWGIDIDSEDWRPATPQEVVELVMSRLENKRSGIILMHDVQSHTAVALPMLLSKLKTRGYGVVHVVSGNAKEAAAHPQ
jgi:peptidoglycan/xylan/chitin deacetylase (PgdA/CDA1 family)